MPLFDIVSSLFSTHAVEKLTAPWSAAPAESAAVRCNASGFGSAHVSPSGSVSPNSTQRHHSPAAPAHHAQQPAHQDSHHPAAAHHPHHQSQHPAHHAHAQTAADQHDQQGAVQHRFGVDTNSPDLDPNVAKENGVTFVVRYISQQATAPITPEEAVNWRNNDMDLVSVWETSVSRPVDGGSPKANFENGVEDAKEARAQMRSLGASGKPIYFAVDMFVDPKHPDRLPQDRVIRSLDDIVPYFDGIRSVLPHERVGAYGSFTTIKGLFDLGKISYGWQSADFDSAGRVDPRANMLQYQTTGVNAMGTDQLDYDWALKKGFGQWRSTLP